ncbi:MAG TPA: hypothetical protein VH475_08640 [Tepidisphaeraceae bacterium]|jgi:hypothetical protein
MIRVVNGKLQDNERPLVVVDRSVMLQRIERFVPDGADIVLPDVFFHEAAQCDPSREGPVFDRWANRHANRIWMARFWRDLSREESTPSCLVAPERIIHSELTQSFRQALRTGGLNWRQCVPEPDAESRRADFVSICSKFSEFVHSQHPDWKARLQSMDERVKWVRHPEQVAEAVRIQNERLRDPMWDDVVVGFPDRLAVSRIARVIVWYALCYSLGKTRGFGNNWEDAEYAVTASYIGRLITTDHGLADAVEACFPSCDVQTQLR